MEIVLRHIFATGEMEKTCIEQIHAAESRAHSGEKHLMVTTRTKVTLELTETVMSS